MDEDEAALLAELRAISSKSAGASRFADDNDDNIDAPTTNPNLLSDTGTGNELSPGLGRQKRPTTAASGAAAASPRSEKKPADGTPSSNNNNNLPPWKKFRMKKNRLTSSSPPSKAAPAPTTDTAEVAVAAAADQGSSSGGGNANNNPQPSEKKGADNNSNGKNFEAAVPTSSTTTSNSSTFTGERGGPAEDAELLALLRGVSSSSARSRFDDDDNNNNNGGDGEGGAVVAAAAVEERQGGNSTPEAERAAQPPAASRKPINSRRGGEPPPWKRRGGKSNATTRAQKQQNQPIEVLVASDADAPAAAEDASGVANNQKSGTTALPPSSPTFTGESGGSAEDAELLALLKGVSDKSSSASRFNDGIADEAPSFDENHRATKAETKEKEEDVARSGSGSAVSTEPENRPCEDNSRLPPWKRPRAKSRRQNQDTIDVVVAGAPIAKDDAELTHNNANDSLKAAGSDPVKQEPSLEIKSDVPSTFTGERGGTAEDAELLALLRGVSSKSSGASRFDDGDGNNADSGDHNNAQDGDAIAKGPSPPPVPSSPKPQNRRAGSGLLPPWKRRGPKSPRKEAVDVDVVVAAPSSVPKPNGKNATAAAAAKGAVSTTDSSDSQPAQPPSYGIKSDIPSTFVGERGGSAEDAELLALLRGVSSSTTRFLEGNNGEAGACSSGISEAPDQSVRSNAIEHSAASRKSQPVTSADAAPRASSASELPAATAAAATTAVAPSVTPKPGAEEEPLCRDDLPAALSDKSWKVRGKAYDLLREILLEMKEGRDEVWDIDANSIVEGLEDRIPTFVEESNVTALDRALGFTLLYAEHCSGAGTAEQAGRIVSSLLKKNGFTSRPTTTKMACALVLKLAEVGTQGVSSVHSVVEVLLKEGITSRKPKVVLSSTQLVLDAARDFGASTLPLASITSSSPKMLSHANAGVRSNGVQILAEICRALGSKYPIKDVIDGMKKAQVNELDSLLSEQPTASLPQVQLRSQRNSNSSACSPEDAVAALAAGAKELEAQRFAARPAVDLMAVLSKTDYSSRVTMAKWSEKVAALNVVLECGGEKPYKLMQPSPSVNYLPLISEIKALLHHTHFAVCSKSMEVLSMLCQGVGEKLYPYLRPLLTPLLKLSKDKKLTRSAGDCLDSFFGNVLGFGHLLDRDDALPSVLDEHKEKNALTRASALGFLLRCVNRTDSAGPRGSLSEKDALGVSSLCTSKLDDSNASVRTAALDTLRALQQSPNPEVKKAVSDKIQSLKQNNPRAYKALVKSDNGAAQKPATRPVSTAAGRANPKVSARTEPAVAGAKRSERQNPKPTDTKRSLPASVDQRSCFDESPISLETALTHCGRLQIPQWDAPEDDGGILTGLKSSKWMLRQDAIKSITAFLESGRRNGSKDAPSVCGSLLVVVGEHTRAFKETNVNIMKAIVQLFMAVSESHEAIETTISSWVMKSGVDVSVSKIADKKLSSGCKSLLTEICTVHDPRAVIPEGFQLLKNVKSPVAHEEYLVWFRSFCRDFGAASIGSGLTEIIPLLLNELATSNVKVKRAAFGSIGTLHSHIGPQFKALTLSLAKPNLKDELEGCFMDHPFDASLQTTDWPKRSLAALSDASKGDKDSSGAGVSLSIPRADLSIELEDDCITKLGSKDGKASWKTRKQALEDVDAALKRCNGLLDVSGPRMNHLVSLLRALRDRLTDTQINLKPLAARVIGAMLSAVDKATQAKLGRIVFAHLISAAMNDIKKPMRDAALGALHAGTTAASLDGGGINDEALEEFVIALVAEVNERSTRAGGLPDVLLFLHGLLGSLSNLDDSTSSRADSLGEKYATVIMECLTSSKSETRAAATMLLNDSVEKEIVEMESIRTAAARLKPAKQRTVGPQIAALQKKAPEKTGKENNEPVTVTSQPTTRQRTTGTSCSSSSARPPATAKLSSRDLRESNKNTGSPAGSPRHLDHPLEMRRGNRGQHATHRTIVWPEYPEDPQGSALLGELKRCWSPLIPPLTATKLFPASGIKKQDDAQEGLEVLSLALEMDRTDGGQVTESQLGFIFKWLVFILCSKETPVGLQALISFIKELLSFLLERKRQLSDGEALVLVPFLFDKASLAKGRFRDLFMEIVSVVHNEELLPVKSLGTTVCVAVMERSSHAKARVLCYHTSVDCLEKEGLAALGKKGVTVAAKSLSEETVSENRLAALDLLEVILSKMNGDMQRLARICGPSLSEKASQLLEERWSKREMACHPHMTSPNQGRAGAGIPDSPLAQLPPFSLRDSHPTTSSAGGYNSEYVVSSGHEPASPSTHQTSPTGGAAALRARLLKIREKSNAYDHFVEASIGEEPQNAQEVFATGIARLNDIVSTEPPLKEEDIRLVECVDTLKRFHAALSKQQHPAAGLTVIELIRLRDVIADHLNETIESLTRLIQFALDSGDPAVNSGMSIPLLSVCLATLMAFFRDSELSPSVSQEDLTLLIRATATALLDPRLASTSSLDEATRSQMVRAINKLAVQAATGASRHVAFQSLVTLQQQLSQQTSVADDDDAFYRRLSRVLSKLFARVIKAEEATPEPYTTETVDMESMVCMMEDCLVACQEAEGSNTAYAKYAIDACLEMVKDLMKSILHSYDSFAIVRLMEDLGINFPLLAPVIASLGDITNEAAIVDELQPSFEESAPSSNEETDQPESPPKDSYLDNSNAASPGSSKDVASLVSNLANAPQGPEQDAAREALRDYTSVNGEEELVEHLKQVSYTFREYIENQLSSSDSTRSRNESNEAGANFSMERLHSLRSRLKAAESAVQSAVEGSNPQLVVPSDPASSETLLPPGPERKSSPPSKIPSPPNRTSRLSRPSPSKLVPPAESKISGAKQSSQTSSLQERLAASQESRKVSAAANSSASSGASSSTSMVRAAALRARLAAMKQKNEQTT